MIRLIFGSIRIRCTLHMGSLTYDRPVRNAVTHCHACGCAQRLQKRKPIRLTNGHAAFVTPMDPEHAKEEVLKALLPTFLRRRGDDVKRIALAAAAGDFDAIATIGHNLRGNGTSYGFPQLSAVGEAIEKCARARDRDAVLHQADRLSEEVARIAASK